MSAKRLLTLVAVLCASLGLTASAAHADPITFGTPIVIPNVSYLDGIACPTAGSCLVVGQETKLDPDGTDYDTDGVIVPVTNGVPGTPRPIPVPATAEPGYDLEGEDIVCPTSSTCFVDGFYQTAGDTLNEGGIVVTVTNGQPQTPQIDPGANSFNGIACWNASSCEAVGDTGSDNTYYGVSAPVSAGVPGTVTVDQNIANGFDAIDCPGANACDALGTDANAGGAALVPIDGGVPGTNEDLSDFGDAFACENAVTCLILGSNAYSPFVNGTAGPPVTANGVGSHGTCPTSTVCWTVGETDAGVGYATVISGGSAGTQTLDYDVTKLVQVVCSSATACLATAWGGSDDGGTLVPITDGSSGGGTGGTGPTGSGGGPSGAAVHVDRVSQSAGAVLVRVGCEHAACTLTVRETIRVRGSHHHTLTETVASARFRLAAGTTRTIVLKLNGTGRAALKRLHRVTAQLTITGAGTARRSVTLTATRR